MRMHRIINETDYKKQLNKAGSKLVVIKFYASWCGHCTMLKPVIDNVYNQFKSDVVFLEVDIDENADITRDEYVVGVPTFVLYKNGERLDVTSNESKLKEMISQHK